MWTNKPLFEGSDELSQIIKLCEILGTPTLAVWPMMKMCPYVKHLTLDECVPRGLKVTVPGLSRTGIDLLQNTLHYDPTTRIHPRDIINHPFLRDACRILLNPRFIKRSI
uniref:Protein kinase domain-containing protein n=1 Tax=Panagrolaimus superbus TaxID=310955 RepID=A0A914ZAF7_9BILA